MSGPFDQPDAGPPTAMPELAARSGAGEERFPCAACGADLRYDPAADGMVCHHCGAREAVEGSGPWRGGRAIEELDLRAALANQLPAAEMVESQVLACSNCGATVDFDPQTHAAECPFCATPVVTGAAMDRHIKPRALLPFAVTEDAARDAMVAWLGRLWFAPGGLQAYARKGRRLQGIYVPFWTYDADTTTRYRGQRGTVYHETRQVRVVVDGKAELQTRQVAKVRWRPVSGTVRRFFDDVLVLGSRSLPKRFTDALAPWDLSALEPYRAEYLAGFRAEAYQVGLEEGYDEAQAIMDRTIQRDVKFDIGGDRQRIDGMQTEIRGATFKHILLPVWLAAYKFRGKTYRFVVNGRTGAVQGERPYSAWKIALAVGLGLIVAGAIGYVIAMEQSGQF